MSALYGYPNYYLETAHDDPVCELGSKFTVKETDTWGGKLGQWEVIYLRAQTTVDIGMGCSPYSLAVANLTSGTTTSATLAAAFPATVGILVGGIMHVDDANAAPAAPEGENSIITTQPSTGLITFDPALTVALAVNDDISIHCPFLVAPSVIATAPACIGMPLARATVGQYFFALQRGIYPNGLVVTAGAGIVAGSGLMPGDAASWIQFLTATWQTGCRPKAWAIGAKKSTDIGINFPIFVDC